MDNNRHGVAPNGAITVILYFSPTVIIAHANHWKVFFQVN